MTKITDVIKSAFIPFGIYYMANQIVLIFMLSVTGELENYAQMQSQLSITIMKMTAMLMAGATVYPYYKLECLKREKIKTEFKKIKNMDLTAIAFAGMFISLVLNYVFAISGLLESSQRYQQVAQIQFSVDLVPALIFYAVISPVVEEVIFRGIVYQSLERNFSSILAIIGSALLFGAFHGNIVQMLYGTFMGSIMAWIYRRYGKIITPVLFHAAANATMYLWSYFF
ncbi:MAG: CPBP family intramembrane metalloprotease [Lachnospiraceae bacterium]|nr:CPBP family intramembrane metalloprotease [Lachnospiraceae bacterium]